MQLTMIMVDWSSIIPWHRSGTAIREPSSRLPSAKLAPYSVQYNHSPIFNYYLIRSYLLLLGCLQTHLVFRIVNFLEVLAGNRSPHLL